MKITDSTNGATMTNQFSISLMVNVFSVSRDKQSRNSAPCCGEAEPSQRSRSWAIDRFASTSQLRVLFRGQLQPDRTSPHRDSMLDRLAPARLNSPAAMRSQITSRQAPGIPIVAFVLRSRLRLLRTIRFSHVRQSFRDDIVNVLVVR